MLMPLEFKNLRHSRSLCDLFPNRLHQQTMEMPHPCKAWNDNTVPHFPPLLGSPAVKRPRSHIPTAPAATVLFVRFRCYSNKLKSSPRRKQIPAFAKKKSVVLKSAQIVTAKPGKHRLTSAGP